MKKYCVMIWCIICVVIFYSAAIVGAEESMASSRVIVSGSAHDGENLQGKTVIAGQYPKKKGIRAFSMHTGLSVSALAANNIVSVPDFFKKTLILDLNTLSRKTIKSGAHLSALADFDWFFQFTVKETHTIKFNTTASADIWGNLSKSVIDFLAKGNTDDTIEGKIHGKLESYVDTGFIYKLKKADYGFSARFAYFVPIVFMAEPKIRSSLSSSDTSVDVDADVYVHQALMSKNISTGTILSNGGFDLSLAGNYAPTSWVDVLFGISYLPLYPAYMNKGYKLRYQFDGQISSDILKFENNGRKLFTQHEKKTTVSGSLSKKKILRPAKIRLGADFRPLSNNYLILSPFIAIPIVRINPFYMDGGAKIESRFAKDVLGVSYALNYIERIVRHDLDFFVDSRWFTFNLGVSAASQSFTRTFYTLSGIGLRMGIGIGF